MQLETVKIIIKEGNEYGYELKHYEGYSGRGMFGRKTEGVTGNLQEILHAIATAGVELGRMEGEPEGIEVTEFLNDMDAIYWDDLGLDTIVY